MVRKREGWKGKGKVGKEKGKVARGRLFRKRKGWLGKTKVG